MEFMARGGQQPTAPAPAPQRVSNKKLGNKGMRIVFAVLLISAALLVASLAVYLGVGGAKEEASYVNKDKFQAVFLNGGQVYFGKIKSLNSKFVTMDNIYYLRVNQQVQPDQTETDAAAQDVSLAKLGCELHGPEDSMVINREQISFWENLKDDGQVAKAIAEFVKANPQGQKCEEPAAGGVQQ